MAINKNIRISYERSIFSYCTKVFKMYHFLFFWYPSKIVLNVKSASFQFQNVSTANSKYFIWYFNLIIVCAIFGLTSCIYVICHASSVSSAKLTVSGGLIGMGVLNVGSSYQIILHVDEIVQGFHCTEQVIRGMEKLSLSTTCKNVQNKAFWEMISTIMQFLTIIFAFIPFFLVPAAIYNTVDPFVITIPLFFPLSWQSIGAVKYLILIIRIYLSAVCAMEACRFYAIYFPTVLQLLEYQLRCVNMVFLYTLPFVEDQLYGLTFFKWYNACLVARRISLDAWCSLIAILQGVGFVIFVTCNVASFKCYGIIPLQVYWIMPTVSIACAFIHYCFLPLNIQVRTLCDRYLKARKHQLYLYCYQPSSENHVNSFALKGFWNRKLYARKLRSLRPMGFSCGPFFEMTNIKSQYFYDIFLRSVDGILLKL